ncbi:hypothetical protein [Streptomyces sp. NPDC007063]|uniref:hypothetical protein n=1 Tax=Streptomyces sp. NPDC007063 TaxID=3364772 RepID=UPI003696F65E
MYEIEKDLRRIIREEIREALRTLIVSAEDYRSYDSEVVEDIASVMLARVVEDANSRMQHSETCPCRNGREYFPKCVCKERS